MVKATNIIALVVFLIILCAVLAVCLLNKSNVEMIRQSRYYHNKSIIYDEYSFKDDKLVYLVCNEVSNCKIVQEKYPFKKNTHSYRSCNVNLDDVGRLSEKSILVVAFGEHNAVLLWKTKNDHSYVRFRVVNLDRCRRNEVKKLHLHNIEDLRNTRKIVTYEWSFIVFYKNFQECKYEECHKPFDINGSETGYFGPTPSIYNAGYDIKNIYSVDARVPHEKYVYEEKSHSSYHQYSTIAWAFKNAKNDSSVDAPVLQEKSNDQNTTITYKFETGKLKNLTNITGEIKLSVIDGSIGVCSRTGITTNCSQYNSAGDFKLNVSLADVNNETQFQSMYTLPEGGFLLSFTETRCEEDACDGSLSSYFIEKIDATGRSVAKLRVQGLEKGYKSIQHSHIWKKENKDEYCAFIVPSREKTKLPLQGSNANKIEFLINCFPISNFEG